MSVSLVSHGEVVGHWCTRRNILIHEHLLVPRDGADACERRVLRLCLDHLAVDGNCILQHGLVNAVASCCCSEGHQETMIATICCIVQEAMVIYSFCVNREETIMHDRNCVFGGEVRFKTPGGTERYRFKNTGGSQDTLPVRWSQPPQVVSQFRRGPPALLTTHQTPHSRGAKAAASWQ